MSVTSAHAARLPRGRRGPGLAPTTTTRLRGHPLRCQLTRLHAQLRIVNPASGLPRWISPQAKLSCRWANVVHAALLGALSCQSASATEPASCRRDRPHPRRARLHFRRHGDAADGQHGLATSGADLLQRRERCAPGACPARGFQAVGEVLAVGEIVERVHARAP